MTIKEWCDKNAHMLEFLSPIDIVIAWEEHRQRMDQNVGDQLRNIQFRLVCAQTISEREHREMMDLREETRKLKQEVKELKKVPA